MNGPTFYEFLELPYLRQKIEYNKIRKSNDKGAEWKSQLILVCNSREVEKLKLLSLLPFCKRYINELSNKSVIDSNSSILDGDSFLIENNIPERYANLFSEIPLAKLKKMSLKELTEVNGIGKATAKKIHELFK